MKLEDLFWVGCWISCCLHGSHLLLVKRTFVKVTTSRAPRGQRQNSLTDRFSERKSVTMLQSLLMKDLKLHCSTFTARTVCVLRQNKQTNRFLFETTNIPTAEKPPSFLLQKYPLHFNETCRWKSLDVHSQLNND